jgi:Flp pilus assembly protein TadG
MRVGRGATLLRRFYRETDGSNAIEFAILAMPFILLLVFIVQIGIFFVSQAALDVGVSKVAEQLRSGLAKVVYTKPNAATLKSAVVAASGALISNDTTLAVEIQPISNLTSATKPIVDATNNYGTDDRGMLALRAKFTVPSFLPGVPNWAVTSSALVRRQGR